MFLRLGVGRQNSTGWAPAVRVDSVALGLVGRSQPPAAQQVSAGPARAAPADAHPGGRLVRVAAAMDDDRSRHAGRWRTGGDQGTMPC